MIVMSEDISEYEEENELILQKSWLEELKIDYHSPHPNGTFNEANDIRVVQLVEMIIRNGTYNEGLTRITLV